MGVFSQVQQQVGVMPPQFSGRFISSAQKREMVMQRTPFWVISIDPEPPVNSRFTNSNGVAKKEWVYHCVPLAGGEEFILTFASNWSRDREAPLHRQALQQSGQALGPAMLVYSIPSGGNRAMHMLADWDQGQPAAAPAYGQPLPQPAPDPRAGLAAAMAPQPAQPQPAQIPWQPVPGVPIQPQPPQAPPQPVQAPPVPQGAPVPPPASPTPAATSTLEGGVKVGAGPDGQAPIQYACGCLATRSTRQVYQPCAVHAPQASAPMFHQPSAAPAAPAAPAAGVETATAMCPRCQQQVTGEVTQVGQARYVFHSNCPADPNPQAQQLLKV